MKKNNQPTKLGDIVHIFKGVGYRDLFEGKRKMPHGAKKCRIVHRSDMGEDRPDYFTHQSACVSPRVLEKNLRGFKEKAILQPGDILISNRGFPITSPVITHKMLKGLEPVVAANELFVIRPKRDCEYSPQHIRSLLNHQSSVKYFGERAKRHITNNSLALSKEILTGLLLNEIRKSDDLLPFIRENTLEDSFEIGKPYPSIKAIIDSSSVRIDQQIKILPSRELDEKLFSWGEISRSCDEKEPQAAQFIEKFVKSKNGSIAEDEDIRTLDNQLRAKFNIINTAIDLPGNHQAIEAITKLVHFGDTEISPTNSNSSVREILSACAIKFKDIAIHAAECGNTAVSVTRASNDIKSITLIEEKPNYRMAAKALVNLAKSQINIYDYENIYSVSGTRNFDLVISESSGLITKFLGKKQQDLNTQGVFNWNGFSSHLKPGGQMIIHIPTRGWQRLQEIKNYISTIIQLPPLTFPGVKTNEYTYDKLIPSGQGLIIVIKPTVHVSDPIRVVNTTRIIDGGNTSENLSKEVIARVAKCVLGETIDLPNAYETQIKRSDIFDDYPEMWPGLRSLLNNLSKEKGLLEHYTLETQIEEFLFYKELSEKKVYGFFEKIGIRPGHFNSSAK
jgi:hypothetical protein